MKDNITAKIFGLCALLLALLFAGCADLSGGGGTAQTAIEKPPGNDILQVGDRVRIVFSGLRTEFEMMPHEEQINESGNISLPLIGSIKSAGKTLGQLQMDIQNAYVPKYYKNLNISVTAERFYFVGGEVRSPNRYPYLSGVTVLQAIQSASDFTDFADRKHVQLKRANGKIEIVNCKKALNDPKLDLPVYPSDTITVPRGL